MHTTSVIEIKQQYDKVRARLADMEYAIMDRILADPHDPALPAQVDVLKQACLRLEAVRARLEILHPRLKGVLKPARWTKTST